MGSKGSMESWGQGTGLSPLVSPNQAPHVLSNQDPSLVMSMQPPRHVQSVPTLGLSNHSHLILSNQCICVLCIDILGAFFDDCPIVFSPQDHPLASKHARWRGRGFAKVRWRMDESQYKSNECHNVALCVGRWHHLPSRALRSTQSEQSFFPRVFFVVSTGYFFDFRFAPSK